MTISGIHQSVADEPTLQGARLQELSNLSASDEAARVGDVIIADLRHWISALGDSGGQIGASVYDTAQVLRLAPFLEAEEQVLDWLRGEQSQDGGWGQPVRWTRDMPTLAAVLALHARGRSGADQAAVCAGLEFLHRCSQDWAGELSDDIPVGSELIIPRLLNEARAAGLDVPTAPYTRLCQLGDARRQLLASVQHRAGSASLHTWEAWGIDPDPQVIDGSGGVGHSPAATAAWLQAAEGLVGRDGAICNARSYLRHAGASTGLDIPGVVPTVWPITRFEQSNSLYALLAAGLLDHPGLSDVVDTQLRDMASAMRSKGIGMSDWFTPDGDDTAEAITVLHAAGHRADLSPLMEFATGDHFCAYHGEIQPSVSLTAHAAHALGVFGKPCAGPMDFIVRRQLPDGRWTGDKWNGSWVYTTAQVLIAMAAVQESSPSEAQALRALLSRQHSDGGWGLGDATTEETAYAVLALRALYRAGRRDVAIGSSLVRAQVWLLERYRCTGFAEQAIWLGKEIYRPRRLARIIELSATYPITIP